MLLPPKFAVFGPLLAFTACLMNFEKLAHGSPQWTQGAQTHAFIFFPRWYPASRFRFAFPLSRVNIFFIFLNLFPNSRCHFTKKKHTAPKTLVIAMKITYSLMSLQIHKLLVYNLRCLRYLNYCIQPWRMTLSITKNMYLKRKYNKKNPIHISENKIGKKLEKGILKVLSAKLETVTEG